VDGGRRGYSSWRREIRLLGEDTLEISHTLDNGQGKIDVISDTPNGINVDGKKTNYNVPNYRCDTLLFIGTETLHFPATVSLTIKHIHALPREGQGCLEYREAVQRILDEKNSGVMIECKQIETNSGFIVAERLNSLSQENAMKIVLDAYQASFTVNGPWVFTGVIAYP